MTDESNKSHVDILEGIEHVRKRPAYRLKGDNQMTQEKILAQNVAFEDYFHLFDSQFVEFVDGTVIDNHPTSWRYSQIRMFLEVLFDAYLSQTEGGKVTGGRFTMKLIIEGKIIGREPDVMVITKNNLQRLGYYYLDGAADLVIEIVEPQTAYRDKVVKFAEYEKAGVREYWIVDLPTQESYFYVLDEQGKFVQVFADASGVYHSTFFPALQLETIELVKNMLKDG